MKILEDLFGRGLTLSLFVRIHHFWMAIEFNDLLKQCEFRDSRLNDRERTRDDDNEAARE